MVMLRIMFLFMFAASANGAEQPDLISTPDMFDIAGWSGRWSVGWEWGREWTVGGSSSSSLGMLGLGQMGWGVEGGGRLDMSSSLTLGV